MDEFLQNANPRTIAFMLITIVFLVLTIEVMYLLWPQVKKYHALDNRYQILQQAAAGQLDGARAGRRGRGDRREDRPLKGRASQPAADGARDRRGMRPRRLCQCADRLARLRMREIERRVPRRACRAPCPEDRIRDVRAPAQNVMCVRHECTPLL